MLSDSDRKVVAGLADMIIPSWERMPSASDVGVHLALLDTVLRVRPDIEAGVMNAISLSRDRLPSEAINGLFHENRAAFDAFTLAVTGAYYMDERVRGLIGYPGQESPPYNPQATPEYLLDGSLERVTRRGAVYKSTPR